MPKLIGSPTPMPSSGHHPRHVEEYFGLVNSGDTKISVAYSRCPGGWHEPAKYLKYDEYTIVLKGALRVEHAEGVIEANAGQAVHIGRDEWVRFSTPGADGAEYISVCQPACSPNDVRWEG